MFISGRIVSVMFPHLKFQQEDVLQKLVENISCVINLSNVLKVMLNSKKVHCCVEITGYFNAIRCMLGWITENKHTGCLPADTDQPL